MGHKYKFLYIILVTFLATNTLFAQRHVISIHVQSRPQKDGILLRWAPSTPFAWKETNNSGFWIDRYTVMRDETILSEAEYLRLTENPIQALPLEKWTDYIQVNDYAAIVAQALYGEDFALSTGGQHGFARVYALSQEQEQRFSMSLFAADKDFEVACLAGWGYKDSTAVKGERYLYRIIPAFPENYTDSVEAAIAYLSVDDYKPLPKPLGLTAEFREQSVALSWNYSLLESVYSSYIIEKSTDGSLYHALPGPPVSQINSAEEQLVSRKMVFVDSLADNKQHFYYRIKGVNTFGEVGPPSDSIFGKAVSDFPFIPFITKALINELNEAEISWEFPQEQLHLLKNFQLNRSVKVDGRYEIAVDSILPNKTTVVFKDLYSSNYFTISAIPYEGSLTTSFPVLLQPLDTMPPAAPLGLSGEVDTLGNLSLTWIANKENDMQGYKLYQAFTEKEVPILINNEIIKDTTYTLVIDVRNLNRRVYYALVAVDQNFNNSPFSEILIVEKPDLIPPSSPLISGYQIKPDGIEIAWINSESEGVVKHQIFRQTQEQDTVVLIATIDDLSVAKFTDVNVESTVKYTYTIYSLKENGLKSSSSLPITLSASNMNVDQLELSRFDAVVDNRNNIIKLNWSDNLKEKLQYYEIYKGCEEESISLWKTLNADVFEIIDTDVQAQKQYHYLIRGVLINGRNTKSKELKIKY